MNLPYTRAESDAAYRSWKAMCGHHSIAAATGRPLEDIRKSGVKLCGWMNPTMVAQCLMGMRVEFFQKLIRAMPNSDEELLMPNYHPRRVLRVQFLGPWMKGPPAVQYRHTHYIAAGNDCIMDPLIDTNVMLSFSDWITWACGSYPVVIEGCTGFAFTHAWNIRDQSGA